MMKVNDVFGPPILKSMFGIVCATTQWIGRSNTISGHVDTMQC